ncbi:MAG: ABC transporter permease [Lachnospiraceae bacterium]|nr:ABC transporter permease [Lachnospiraceae bacterium]
MWKKLCPLLLKDCRMMASGKFFFVAFGSLLAYTLFIHFGYLKFMDMEIYNVYLYDPAGILEPASPRIHPAASLEELDAMLVKDINGVGIDASSGNPDIILYTGAENLDRHRADYAVSLLYSGREYTPETVGSNNLEMKNRKDITCELLFIEIVAVGFLGIASVLFKEKQMGVIRVHAIMPLHGSMFVCSKIFLFVVTDLLFAALITVFNVGLAEAGGILPAILIQTGLLSLIMALTGFGCTMLLKDFKQFSLAYLVIALFAATPVFLSANTSIKMGWIIYHPSYHVYMGLKNAFFGMPVTNPVYYICAGCVILMLFGIVSGAFRKEMGKEG